MAENRVVPEALGEKNYEIWSNCMKIYLLSQDLWEVIEPESEESSKAWRRKNALALHAIHMSCGATSLSKIGKLESAKEAWELLRSTNISDPQSENDETNNGEESPVTIVDGIDYDSFMKASKEGDWRAMKEFLDSHPDANACAVVSGRTALHRVLDLGNLDTLEKLVSEIEQAKDLETPDSENYTAFARLSNRNQPGVVKLLKHMVSKNADLPNIGEVYSVPVVVASWKGYEESTRYLYSVTDEKIIDPDFVRSIGIYLLINCINIRLFDIALEIVTKFPKILQQSNNDDIYPIHALAKSFSALKCGSRPKKSRAFRMNSWLSKSWRNNLEHVKRLLWDEEKMFQVLHNEKFVYNQAREFLRFVCVQVKTFDTSMLETCVHAAMIEASKNGIDEFVSEMLVANPNLIEADEGNKPMFWHAIENRQEKVYNLIYSFLGKKDHILSYQNDENDKVLHLVARLPPSVVLDRSSGPALQMQRELQWFQEVWSLANPRYREDLNNDGFAPRTLFTKTHADLLEAGEKYMKDTAQSSTVIGALIITVMFAVAFTVPGGNNSDTGSPIYSKTVLFRIFIVCDALSLYSSTTSVLVFLGILTSRYAEEDFFVKLPRKMIIGITTLFFSIITMMISFCTALALMLQGELRYILPTVLLAFVPIMIFVSSIVPVLSEIYMSTFGKSIFVKTGTLLEKKVVVKSLSIDPKKLAVEGEGGEKEVGIVKESEVVTNNHLLLSSIDENVANEVEEESILNDPTIVDKEEEKNIVYNPSSVDEIV